MLGNPLPTSLTSSNAAKAAWMGSCEGCPMNRSNGNYGNTQGKGQQDHTSKCKPFQTVEHKKQSKQIQTAYLSQVIQARPRRPVTCLAILQLPVPNGSAASAHSSRKS